MPFTLKLAYAQVRVGWVVNANGSSYREKKSLHDSQRDTPRVQKMRQVFHEQTMTTLCDIAAHLKFIDESGAHLGLTRLVGRAAPGCRP